MRVVLRLGREVQFSRSGRYYDAPLSGARQLARADICGELKVALVPSMRATHDGLMQEVTLRTVIEADLTAPPGGILKSVKVKIELDPPTGIALIYGAPFYIDHVRVDGPTAEVDIPTSEPKVYIQLVGGAKRVKVWTLGYKENRAL